MILDFIKGFSTWIIVVLLVVVLGLAAVTKFQGSKIMSLREINATMASELMQTKRQLSDLDESHKKTLEVLEQLSVERKALEEKKKTNKQRIRDVIKDGKTHSTAVTVELNNSMWSAYCDGNGSSCPAK